MDKAEQIFEKIAISAKFVTHRIADRLKTLATLADESEPIAQMLAGKTVNQLERIGGTAVKRQLTASSEMRNIKGDVATKQVRGLLKKFEDGEGILSRSQEAILGIKASGILRKSQTMASRELRNTAENL